MWEAAPALILQIHEPLHNTGKLKNHAATLFREGMAQRVSIFVLSLNCGIGTDRIQSLWPTPKRPDQFLSGNQGLTQCFSRCGCVAGAADVPPFPRQRYKWHFYIYDLIDVELLTFLKTFKFDISIGL